MPERPNYFTGKLLSAADLALEQEYQIEKGRRHNRLLHGWGVVQGFAVQIERDAGGDRVRVEPGYALDCQGNEIILDEAVSLVLPAGDPDAILWVTVRWAEEPVGALPRTGQGEKESQANRVREICQVEFASAAPGHAGGPACGEPHPLAAARLRFARIRWREDPGFEPKRISG